MLKDQDQTVLKNETLCASGLRDSTVHGGPEATQDAGGCKDAFGLYVHIPFCEVKCPYCDFYTCPATGASMERYSRAVCREIIQGERFERRRLDSIFFGGGTPSLLPRGGIAEILRAAQERFDLRDGAEVTLEINPENVTTETAREWNKLGINRASLGVQSLDDGKLARLKRTHRSSDSLRVFEILREAGFTNISVDLIFGLEGETVEGWESTLRGVLGWKPDHVSAYALTIEEKTLFAVELRQGRLRLPPEEGQVRMFSRTREILSDAGLPPYEISNFAKPGFESTHNLNYWTGGDYWGVGVSAHSFRRAERIERWWNLKSVPKYVEAMERGGDPSEGRETLSAEQHWNERLITGLRLIEGVDLFELRRDLTVDPSAHLDRLIDRFVETGRMERNGPWIRLTTQGLVISDGIFADLVS